VDGIVYFAFTFLRCIFFGSGLGSKRGRGMEIPL
jgi:hypothetical protein